MKTETIKKCKTCERKLPVKATGPWCHTCVLMILALLAMNQKTVAAIVSETEVIRQQLREAKAEGRPASSTDVPGPYWGLEL